MSVTARANEPSMEEILASIRRIIADEVAPDPLPIPPPAAARPVPPRPVPVREARTEVPAPQPSSGRPAREPLGVAASRPALPAPAPLRSRSEPLLPPTAGRMAPLVAAESPYSYGSGSPGFRAPPSPPNYAPAGRAPSVDPLATQPRSLASAAPARILPEPVDEFRPTARPNLPPARPVGAAPRPETLRPVPAVPPAPEAMDAPLASVLLDLALVEQAVQAELANVALDAAAKSAPKEAEADEAPTAEAAPIAETADMQGHAIKDLARDEAGSEPSAVEPAKAEAPVAEAAVANTATEAGTEAAKLETAKAEAVEPAPAKPAPTLPRAFVPSFRSEPRSNEPRLPETRFGATRAAAAEASAEPARERLVSGPTNNAVTSAFTSLHRTVAPSARTVDDLVTEALRPMLKSWLDENLPALVEKLVRAEIERVARQGQ